MILKQIKQYLLLIIFCVAITGVYSQEYSKYDKTENKFGRALQFIKLFYVDTVNDEKLVESAIRGMLKDLDPHSVYMSKEEQIKANEPLQGSFNGIGVQFQILNDTIMVISPTTGGPSEKIGIIAGDRIVTIDGEDATGSKIDNNYVITKLRGDLGSSVKVGILRKYVDNILEFTIIRDKIPINSIDASFILTDKIGYIKLNRFSRTTMQEFNETYNKLKNDGMTSLILDLRGNSGGFLDVSISLSEEFLPKGKLIVYTEGNASPREDYISKKNGKFEKGKLIILIDEGSASASEIVAGALQDWDRAVIIGRRSFGKGLVQRPFDLPDGSIIRLTTAKYYTPSGRNIQKSYEGGTDDYNKDLVNRYNNGELTTADSIHFPDSLKFFTSNNRVVYGGGGIMPDIFIPLDTTKASDYYTKLIRKGIFNQFTYDYVDKHRADLKIKYTDFEMFKNKFIVTDELLNDFYAFAEQKEIPKDEEGINTSKEYIILQIKALIARNVWDFNAYIQMYSTIDDAIIKAIEVINDGSIDKMKIKY